MQTFRIECKKNNEKLRQLLAIKTEPEDFIETNNAIGTTDDCETTKFFEVNVDQLESTEYNPVGQDQLNTVHIAPKKDNLLPCHICGKLYKQYKLQYHLNMHEGKWKSLIQFN